MYISFFKNNNEAIIGTDYSWHNDILHQEDLDFNPETQIAELIENNWKFSIKISPKLNEEKIESETEKRNRIFNAFVEAENLENFDWEWVTPTESDYNHLIVLRNFRGDHGSQIAAITKSIFKIFAILIQMGIKKEQINTIFSDEIAMVKKISESRVALGLSPFDISFLE